MYFFNSGSQGDYNPCKVIPVYYDRTNNEEFTRDPRNGLAPDNISKMLSIKNYIKNDVKLLDELDKLREDNENLIRQSIEYPLVITIDNIVFKLLYKSIPDYYAYGGYLDKGEPIQLRENHRYFI